MASKLKTEDEVQVEAANLKKKDASVNTEMETSEVTEVVVEHSLADTANDHHSQNAHDQCGGALRASRIEQDLSTQAVAKQLRMGNAHIEALENNDFSALPEPTIVKGFIRNYAKLLKISAEPILAAYAELMPKTEQYAYAVGRGINMRISNNTKSSSVRYLILTILFLLGLGAWFFYQHYIQKPDVVNQTPEIAEMFPEELSLQMTTQEGELPTIDSPEMTDEALTSERATDATAPVADSAVAEAEEVIAVPKSEAETAATVKTTRLEFNATQETWVSVVNKSGEEVYNKILYAGNRDIIDIQQPSEIIVGNAHGATLIVDGKPMSLAPYTRINVARVRLTP